LIHDHFPHLQMENVDADTTSNATLIHNDQSVPIPKDVREQPTAFTSVYSAGELVYDGAAAAAAGSSTAEQDAARHAAADRGAPQSSLNEFLKWGIQNSDPERLAQAKARGAAPPSKVDREIMDVLLGEPIVAKMRACLTVVEQALDAKTDLPAAIHKLEELEYYVEDIDNALDMAKIGGLQTLLRCLPRPASSPSSAHDQVIEQATSDTESTQMVELQRGTCSVLAASLQNHPKVQSAAIALNFPAALLHLLGSHNHARPDQASEQYTAQLEARQKALLALSALARSSDEGRDALLSIPDALPHLLSYCQPEADPKLRRRSLFLLKAIATDSKIDAAKIAHQLCIDVAGDGTSIANNVTTKRPEDISHNLHHISIMADHTLAQNLPSAPAPAPDEVHAGVDEDCAQLSASLLRLMILSENEREGNEGSSVGKLIGQERRNACLAFEDL